MNQDQTTIRISGAFFLIPLLAYGIGSHLISTHTDHPDPSVIASSRPQLVAGALLILLNSVAVTTVAILLYPVLSRFRKRTGLWYLSARITEAILLLVGLIFLLLLFTLSVEQNKTSLADPTCVGMLHQLAVEGNYWAYQLAMIVLGLGSIPFCHLLFKERLVPVPLSLLGLLGYILLAFGACLELFGYGAGIFLSIPGGLFELALGVWLMVIGFRPRVR